MKNFTLKMLLIALMLTTFTSCEVIGDIFQAGLVVGIVIVVLIIVLIMWIIRKFRR